MHTIRLSTLSLAACCFSLPASAQSSPPAHDDFQSGGLAPPTAPPPIQTQHPGFQSETERTLDESEKEDAGRNLDWVYFDVEGGYEVVGLETLKSKGLTYDDAQTSDGGLMLGTGLGLRLIYMTVGARARVGMLSLGNLGTINGEFGVNLPLGDLEPSFHVGAGYAFLASPDADRWGGDPTIHGWNTRLGAGFDYYVTPAFSVGARLSGDVLFLSRKAMTLEPTSNLGANARQAASSKGNGIGAAFSASLGLALHL
ncbi:MAG TPA: hypothetical protein PLJ27_02605 [Polyangiaceae bacterium]|jgi:hypothetical protein|nr:MAG: hypothetical protein BWY17_02432 [Deltaproteobacteria bacterium ADurb.Bin207]HNS98183.1 hypothetical protein [Polyangiaceae bacterium]HNZ22624.1 hypothetical protein [Polyangiaceae bacterium]HOD21519.1 hypothetical protein [Polyangiaceae bacterium]HOE48377.1 hypothetical protein [Polyangiaceae bacterium]